MPETEYEIVKVEPGSQDWANFHEIQRTALFEQDVNEYDPHYHDACFQKPAQRSLLLLKWKGASVGVTTLDHFADNSAATRGVAIATEFQGRGHGMALGKLTQEFARAEGVDTLCVNAGDHAVGYYQRLGFEKEIWNAKEYEGISEPEKMIQMVCRKF